MKQILRNILASSLIAIVFTACDKNLSEITMITEVSAGDTVLIHLTGRGFVTIDWGDGSEKVRRRLKTNDWWQPFEHTYSTTATRTITVSGNKITGLLCSHNQLTSLDVSKATALGVLDCSHNQLTNLDLSKNTALDALYCSNNQLTNLDVSNNIALRWLDCSNNQLTNLDLSTNTILKKLYCHNNLLTSLDVSKNTALIRLRCSSNRLTSLNVSGATKLTELWCRNNQLTSLDLSDNTALRWVLVSENDFSEDALNALFHTLHSNDIEEKFKGKVIGVGSTKGDRSIAERKDWVFWDWNDWSSDD